MKNKLVWPRDGQRGLIEPAPPPIRIARQGELVGLARSSFYYAAQGERAENLQWRRVLDEPYTRTPDYGLRRMTAWLRQQGPAVNPKRVARLLRTMGVETLSPTPRRSQPHPERRVYPDVLRGVPMTRVNPVWSTDIPSIRLQAGCVSLVAVMEWFRRDVLSWAVSMTMAGGCCLEAWEQALGGATPALVTSAQGAQVTRADCTRRLEAAGVHIRMAGRRRALDHGFVERLWRTVNDEEVYVKDDRTPREARHG